MDEPETQQQPKAPRAISLVDNPSESHVLVYYQ